VSKTSPIDTFRGIYDKQRNRQMDGHAGLCLAKMPLLLQVGVGELSKEWLYPPHYAIIERTKGGISKSCPKVLKPQILLPRVVGDFSR
jgi:hypothetical protein